MKLFDEIKLRRKINTLENKNEELERVIKEGLYEAFINELYKPKINQLEDEIRLLKRELEGFKKGKKQ